MIQQSKLFGICFAKKDLAHMRKFTSKSAIPSEFRGIWRSGYEAQVFQTESLRIDETGMIVKNESLRLLTRWFLSSLIGIAYLTVNFGGS